MELRGYRTFFLQKVRDVFTPQNEDSTIIASSLRPWERVPKKTALEIAKAWEAYGDEKWEHFVESEDVAELFPPEKPPLANYYPQGWRLGLDGGRLIFSF